MTAQELFKELSQSEDVNQWLSSKEAIKNPETHYLILESMSATLKRKIDLHVGTDLENELIRIKSIIDDRRKRLIKENKFPIHGFLFFDESGKHVPTKNFGKKHTLDDFPAWVRILQANKFLELSDDEQRPFRWMVKKELFGLVHKKYLSAIYSLNQFCSLFSDSDGTPISYKSMKSNRSYYRNAVLPTNIDKELRALFS